MSLQAFDRQEWNEKNVLPNVIVTGWIKLKIQDMFRTFISTRIS